LAAVNLAVSTAKQPEKYRSLLQKEIDVNISTVKSID
jgi:hypothetical protein